MNFDRLLPAKEMIQKRKRVRSFDGRAFSSNDRVALEQCIGRSWERSHLTIFVRRLTAISIGTTINVSRYRWAG